jgi:hypothetical protein
MTTNPDSTVEPMHVHGEPFCFNPSILGVVYCYPGFRPTATRGPGYGDEGVIGSLARWLKRRGWGNLGMAIRRAK